MVTSEMFSFSPKCFLGNLTVNSFQPSCYLKKRLNKIKFKKLYKKCINNVDIQSHCGEVDKPLTM